MAKGRRCLPFVSPGSETLCLTQFHVLPVQLQVVTRVGDTELYIRVAVGGCNGLELSERGRLAVAVSNDSKAGEFNHAAGQIPEPA
jgi:hypothetical protein